VASALTSVLAGCTGSGHADAPVASDTHAAAQPATEARPTATPLSGFVKDLDHWTTPLDGFAFDDVRAEYALNLLRRDCMEAKGYHNAALAAPDLSRPASWTVDGMGRWRLTKAGAARYGYQGAPDARIDADAVHHAEDVVASYPKKEVKTWSSCSATGLDSFPDITEPVNYAEGLRSNAIDTATATPAVVAATKKWHTCMAPLGIPWLTANPDDMAGDGRDAKIVATYDTKKIASQDYACRVSSGYQKAYYNALVDAETTLVNENQDRLTRLADIVTAYHDKVEKTLDQYGVS
jgi:hypothetical protein